MAPTNRTNDPAADGIRAAKTDRAVARAKACGDTATLALIERNLGTDEYTRRYAGTYKGRIAYVTIPPSDNY